MSEEKINVKYSTVKVLSNINFIFLRTRGLKKLLRVITWRQVILELSLHNKRARVPWEKKSIKKSHVKVDEKGILHTNEMFKNYYTFVEAREMNLFDL